MSIISESLSQISIGEPQVHQNLAMFPLLIESETKSDYLLLDDALAQGCARVTEISESGSVPELKFDNRCDQSVLLIDGEELVGAKQNRILNLSVLAPAGQTIVIPVSCVEAGRWNAQSNEFASVRRAHYAAGRAKKAAHVSHSLRTSGTRRSDQSRVWADIADKSARMQAPSSTGAAAAMYEMHQSSLDEYLGVFQSVEKQAGALFAINGKAIGFDLFDHSQTLEKILPKLVQSYALDAVDAGQTEAKVEKAGAEKMLEEAARAVQEQFPAVGEGHDLRIRSQRLSGGALVVDEKIIHLCAFSLSESDHVNSESRQSRFVRASMRRRTN